MKKIMFGIVTLLAIFIFFFGKHVAENNEETSEGNQMVMLAPDLDVSQISDEDMAILIEQGWDFSGEVPSLTIREEDVDYEVINGVVDLGELFDAMDQNVSEPE